MRPDAELTGRPAQPGPARSCAPRPEELDDERRALWSLIAEGPRRAQARVPLVDGDGRLLGPFGLMLLSPRIGAAVQSVGAALRFDEDLPARLRELAVLTVAAAVGSEFEWAAHEAAALEAGAEPAQLQDLLDDRAPGGLAPAEEVGLQVVRALLARHTLDDPLFERASAVLGTPGLAALVWLVGYYEMLATALATFRPGPAVG
ncbi:carboxymuconolactone decarboxylase family protein [Modestobacter excelsi]|uniref:carboxymuconolactone decarboxylase family protein n=1 Tax=Modestobacter excelsi TaxID=2213161 RepID=UPI00110D087E|nr:carboxymuconolactone decarboxylase family protein [Modestobacter excelsi]